ncbi:restriction endonuclease subunit S [Mesorhizobium sp. M0387]|uniref:restriction endonuclease subunit S n=1 Tax=Mesorhizobium sp. M0387 TaxID=2956940 RepID=UPI00333D89A0
MSTELPEGWAIRNLGSIIDFVNGYAFKPEDWQDVGTPIIRIQNLNGSAAFNYYGSMIPERYHVRTGDLLFCWSGSRGTSFGARKWNGALGFLNQHIFRCVVSSDLHSEFAYFLLEGMTAAIENEAHGGGGLVHIKKSEIVKFEAMLPPLDEQQRIAEVLRSVDEAVATKQETVAALKRFKRCCREAAVQRFKNSEITRLQTILASIDAGWSPDCDGEPAGDGEWSILKTSAVAWEGYNDEENKRLPAHMQPRPNLEVASGDILITRAGPAERTGVVASVRETKGRRMLSDKVIRLRVSPEKAVPLAISELLAADDVQDQLSRSKSGMAASQTNISQNIVLRLELRLPPLADQRDFASEMAALQDAITISEADLRDTKATKIAIASDLLSGRVRVPLPVIATTKSAPPAFKRAVFAAEIVHQLYTDNRFGSVKHEKIVHLCELHLGLQADLDRHAYKEAAGPYDPKARRSVERIFQQQKWFDVKKPDGHRVIYAPLEKVGEHAVYFDRYFGDQKVEIQSIIDLLRPLNTEQCEIVATLYAVWNDFLIDGQQPKDDELVASVLQWHPKKQEIGEDRWRTALPWMRQKGLVPKGIGEKTRVARG